MARPRGVGEFAAHLMRSLESGDKDGFVSLVSSREDAGQMWEVAYRLLAQRNALAEQQRALEEELGEGTEIALVLEVLGDGTAIVLKRGSVHRVNLSRNGNPGEAAEAYPGAAIVLDKSDHFALVSLGDWRWANEVGHINYVMDGGKRASVDVNGREHILTVGRGLDGNGGVSAGARVLCSVADRLIQSAAPEESRAAPYEVQNRIPEGYGLKGIDSGVRARIESEIVRPLRDFEELVKQGWEGPLHFIFSGPTGTGKTHAIDQACSQVPGCALLRRWPSDFRHPLFGVSAKSVRKLSDEALALAQDRAVIVALEEADVYLTRRSNVYGSVARTELSIESELFRLCDHLPKDRPAALIVTTNVRWNLEPAVLRRFGNHVIEFPYLGEAEVSEMVDHWLSRKPEWLEEDKDDLVRRATARFCDRGQPLLSALVDGVKREWTPADLVSPALVASVMSSAANEALGRRLSGDGNGGPRMDWPLLATSIHRGYLDLARVINRDNIAEYAQELQERRVSEVTCVWPEQPVEAYLVA